MKVVNIYEAKTKLSRLLREVAAGEDIVIAKDGTPLARLIPFEAEEEVRDLGFAKGSIVIEEDFDEPLPDDILEDFGASPA
jgi:prevent-host-death family protein